MHRLSDLKAKLATETDVNVALGEILGVACAFTGTDRGCVQLVSADGTHLEMVAWRGYAEDGPFVTKFRYEWFAQGGNATGVEGRRLLIEDTRTFPGFVGTELRAAVLADGILAAQSMPMISREGEALGVLSTQFRHPHRPSEDQLLAIDLLAWIAADFVQRSRAEAALRESEARLTAITDYAPVGIGLFDCGGRWVFKNPALEHSIPGHLIPSRDAVQRGRWHAIDETGRRVPPENWPGQRALRGEAVIDGIDFRVDVERRDCWLKVTAAPVPGDGAVNHVVVIVEDVTERRQAEQERALLAREVNHRSKNILSIVKAVARATAGSRESEFAQKFERRIQALSANQSLLINGQWRGVDLEELVRSQLAHFPDLLDRSITLSGPPIIVKPSASQSLGMALHELATNAGKYGALSTSGGRVDIKWSVQPDGQEQPRFKISWCESDGPEVAPPARAGFGSKVIRDMAGMNLDADITLDYARSGLVWELDCPAERCVEGDGHRLTGRYRPAGLPKRSGADREVRGRILVVEDEALVALELAEALEGAGHEVIGPAGSVRQALALLGQAGCDAAVLDVNLGEETAEPVARRLANEGTPFLVVSGYARGQLPDTFRNARLFQKPARLEAVIAELEGYLLKGDTE